MTISRNSIFKRAVVIAAFLVYASTASTADEEAVPNEDATEDAIEEVVVYGYKSGDKVDLDARYEELFRSRAAAEMQRDKDLNDEYEWRKSMAPAKDSSRIKWGYDIDTEMRMRGESSLAELPTDTVKPATLFRAEF